MEDRSVVLVVPEENKNKRKNRDHERQGQEKRSNQTSGWGLERPTSGRSAWFQGGRVEEAKTWK